jgi:hypothetical protein
VPWKGLELADKPLDVVERADEAAGKACQLMWNAT